MRFTTLFCDLDDTLYPASSGLWQMIKERIGQFMHERICIPLEDVPQVRLQYFQEYGTALRGLEANYSINREEYLTYVHDLPLADYLQPDAELHSVLKALPIRKLILTNSDAAHARRVLAVLQIEDCFDAIVDINTILPYCKPQPEALAIALKIANESDPSRCVLIDDLSRTTRAAREFGFFSILFGQDGSSPDADATLQHWRDLPAILNGKPS